ncbi:MAG: chemotaxis protein CheD [Peptococcaceae bacterium]|jgi:chemotaxis protein CheD|nr:chemotaxis protein CheD [Peptococcaceae bacterium]MDH7524062.1 chemotaxis protein CheD [Peptococcaceae bacterium]
MQNEPIRVGMADFKTAVNSSSLITTGLGSCVGVCLWDPLIKLGGMIHIMLPDSTQSKVLQNKAKYADTGIVLLVEEMGRLGASQTRLVAKIAGGAQMFTFPNSSNIMRIGERNVEAVKRCLALLKIKILAEDTGGSFGRTIKFFTSNAQLHIRTISKGEKII